MYGGRRHSDARHRNVSMMLGCIATNPCLKYLKTSRCKYNINMCHVAMQTPCCFDIGAGNVSAPDTGRKKSHQSSACRFIHLNKLTFKANNPL